MLLAPPLPAPVALTQLLADPSSSHTAHLTLADAARARVRTALKATRKDGQRDGRAADWAGTARALAEYLPHLYAILACVEADDLLLRADPVFFAWRASLSSQALKKGSKRVPLPSLHAELTATLLSYALCLANQASSLVASLGSYEIASSVTTTALKVHDETINQAADTLCRASGILMHLAEVVIPRWEAAVGIDALRARPVEMSREVTTALAKTCLADANLLAIRRLLSRSLQVAHSTTTPGPPLPPSHPSPALLAKLHLQVYTLYDEARSAAKTASSSAVGAGDLSPALRRYLSDGRTLALALAYKWLGVDAGERGETGDALGLLGMARGELEALRDKDRGLRGLKGFGTARQGGKGRKGKVAEEVDSTDAFRSAYKKVNDTVHFQPVPSPQTLQSRLPSGRAALALKPFATPSPAFRPRATGAPPPSKVPPPPPLGTAFAGLSLADGAAAADSSDEEDDDDEGGYEALGSYFGAGQYF
ncbi:hypothetical protein DMC30DRAFT_249364 [Rhodotorula diobovata]|uniref:pH-response regulator protein palC n=1 Tax=Rhodotorula diobovata TaxID=5288 RepID=A0A5C5FW64_9BASI|nr:hypothetical protein DMC30DRAFT_249364 [Rhodotorula diobovata]